MANYNKVLLMGNLTRDPQLSYTPNQTAVVDFGMAVNRRWTGQDGSQRDETCFVDCRMFGRRAEVINKYCRKGNPLFVEGRLTFDSWEAQDGSKRSKLRVTVENFEFVGGGGGGAGGGGGGRAAQSFDNAGSQGPPPPSDDDIPF
ncbi:MAG: single-stranded DNA-binding protein [Sedimentisphaerales bacterium]|jgi:single-strand DNA-binding protein